MGGGRGGVEVRAEGIYVGREGFWGTQENRRKRYDGVGGQESVFLYCLAGF